MCSSDLDPLIISPGESNAPVATVYGIPFDSTHSYKPGCRFGPDAIRKAFNNIEIFHPDLGVDLEGVSIEDLGNAMHTANVEEMLDMVSKITSELTKKERLLIILGGEHSLTYGTYTSVPKDTGYIVFDAHYDLRDGYAGEEYSHASYLRRVVEKNGSDKIIHVGARSFVKEELAFLKENKIRTSPSMRLPPASSSSVRRVLTERAGSVPRSPQSRRDPIGRTATH